MLETNDKTISDFKEVIKRQFENAPKYKDDEKIPMTQIIELIRLLST